MAEPCTAVHPQYGEQCILNGNHANHLCRPEDFVVPVQWPNDAYVPPPKKKQWQPKPPRKFSFGEMRDIQAEANHHAAQETARLEKTLFASTEELVHPHAFENGTETSRDSADDIRSVSAPLRIKVLLAIAQSGEQGMTDEMIEKRLVMKHQTASARRRELALAKMIESKGTALNHSGSRAQLWVITDEGRRALEGLG